MLAGRTVYLPLTGVDRLTLDTLSTLCVLQVRQYFVDSSFYADDVTARGFCGGSSGYESLASFTCAGFSPSSATVKVLHSYHVSSTRVVIVKTNFVNAVADSLYSFADVCFV